MSFLFSKNLTVIDQDTSQKIMSILLKIEQILEESKNKHQSKVINKLIHHLENNEHNDLVKLLNSRDMWGGSGAVWEVNIDDDSKGKEFELQIIGLINIMEETSLIKKRGIRGVRKIFEKNEKLRKS